MRLKFIISKDLFTVIFYVSIQKKSKIQKKNSVKSLKSLFSKPQQKIFLILLMIIIPFANFSIIEYSNKLLLSKQQSKHLNKNKNQSLLNLIINYSKTRLEIEIYHITGVQTLIKTRTNLFGEDKTSLEKKHMPLLALFDDLFRVPDEESVL